MAPSLTKAELSQCMRNLVLDGLIGPTQERGLTYSTVREDNVSITFVAALVSFTEFNTTGLDRHLITLAKEDGALLSTVRAYLDDDGMAKVLYESGCGRLIQYNRLGDGSFGTTYKAKTDANAENITGSESGEYYEYAVQLRYHANIDSMYHLIQYIRKRSPQGLPIPYMPSPPTSPNPFLGIQISRFVPGNNGSNALAGLTLDGKQSIIKQMARAFAALWDLPVPGHERKLIGEAIVSPDCTVSVGPERRYGLGGPFPTVTSYLQAWIKHRVSRLQEQQLVDEYKERYLGRILGFVESSLNHIPVDVEDVKLSLVHTDLAPHNMIFSVSESPTQTLKAVIDWEFVDHAPPQVAIPTLIEPTFEVYGKSESDALRQAFWEETPAWKQAMASKGSQDFLDLYSFGFYLKADALPDLDADLAAKEQYWHENIREVERFLGKWEKL